MLVYIKNRSKSAAAYAGAARRSEWTRLRRSQQLGRTSTEASKNGSRLFVRDDAEQSREIRRDKAAAAVRRRARPPGVIASGRAAAALDAACRHVDLYTSGAYSSCLYVLVRMSFDVDCNNAYSMCRLRRRC
ncbi:hypothetical protein EVAR_37240_1 [Eumeta japonica]|uniref:Uncharacterized protein n=1 Tax=Eumeta variegata TaxID=151549 RepID=A0A4C1Y9L9_EUMVA|nr:hypothetical protein EVAR_37240_1 [Eumeta japonica]